MWLAPSSFCPPEEKNFNLTLSWNKPFPPWVAFIWIFCLSKRKEVKTQLWERVAWFSMAFIVSSEQTTVSLSFCFKIGEPEKNIIDHWLIVNVASWIAPTYCQNYCASHLLGRRDMCGTKYFKMLAVFPSWDPTLLFHFYVNIIFLISREESKWLFFCPWAARPVQRSTRRFCSCKLTRGRVPRTHHQRCLPSLSSLFVTQKCFSIPASVTHARRH